MGFLNKLTAVSSVSHILMKGDFPHTHFLEYDLGTPIILNKRLNRCQTNGVVCLQKYVLLFPM